MGNVKPAPQPGPASGLFALTGATFKQLVRDPAILLIASAAFLLIALAPFYAVFHFGELAKVMIDTGLSTVLLAGLGVGLLGPARAVAYELEDRTALTLLSKPVGRFSLIAGKYLGVLLAIIIVVVPLAFTVLYVTRIALTLENTGERVVTVPVLGWSFPASLVIPSLGLTLGIIGAALLAILRKSQRWAFSYGALLLGALAGVTLTSGHPDWQYSILTASALIAMEVAVIAAVAAAAAARFSAMGTLVVGLAFMIGGHLRYLSSMDSLASRPLVWALSVVPGLEALNVLEATAGGASVGMLYVAAAGLYATMYVLSALLIGAALIHGREVA